MWFLLTIITIFLVLTLFKTRVRVQDDHLVISYLFTTRSVPLSKINSIYISPHYAGDSSVTDHVGIPSRLSERLIIETVQKKYLVYIDQPRRIVKSVKQARKDISIESSIDV
ncbi:hypothetical protein N781_14405 [Pontibacillus halophilus JSM 076056 = DSM 19796]|uniref:Sublancin immunity protein SunI-like PH domain-containing protein n=1 Tax=Pontibacillus halophilus JSM 076056 = DSM 19796 TaxID=1385510 RepID=A0A0A5GND6_9BACI|nr:hypothetical protein [Pontibacillus halophilus]KGX92763.1 hypothetical protein N781_14405 [Pontibacillus halophilus JSM 076056 = DSM 19796]